MKSEEGRSLIMKKGFYTKVGKDFVGVYLTPNGPKMFINREQYDLVSPCWDVEMVMGSRNHIINFYWNGEVKLSVRCEAEQDVFMPLYDYLSCREETVRLA